MIIYASNVVKFSCARRDGALLGTMNICSGEKQPPEVLLEISYEICEISKNTFFTEHLRTTASVQSLSVEAACLIVQQQTVYHEVYEDSSSLYAEIIFCLFLLHTNRERHELLCS